MSSVPEAGALRRRLVWHLTASAAVTTAIFITYYQLIAVIDSDRSRVEVIGQNVVVAVLSLAVLALIASERLRRRLEPTWSAVLEGNASPDTSAALLRQPAYLAGFTILLWLLPAFLSPIDDVVERHYRAALAEFVGIVLGSLAVAALVYLLTERALRPLFRRAFAGDQPPPEVPVIGVRARFLVAWALGSGVPFLGIVATPFIRTGELPPIYGALCLAVTGLVVGAVMTSTMSASVADPLDAVVAAMRRIEAGDLDVAIEADDAGDIGRVQSGLNRMAAGLRERARLEDMFGRHVGIDVARAALERGAALGGESQRVSVLFVDMVGSTAVMSARPEDAVALANRFFAHVVRAVTAHGGWVDKFQGDGAMCVFGAPVPTPAHAANALAAAADLRARLAGEGIDAAIGVASGPVVAGNVGTEDRFEYTVMGSTVHRASRLCEEAKRRPARALASCEPPDAPPDNWQPIGDVTLRGFDTPTAVWELPA